MPKTPKLDNFLDYLVTSYDIAYYKDMVSVAISDIYKTSTIDDKFMNSHFDSILLSILDKNSLLDSLKEVSSFLDTLHRVDLVLAEMPDHDFLLVLKQKISQTFSDNHIYFDINIDKSIYGGFKVIFAGRYFDQSLITLISKQLVSSKEKL